MPYKIRDLKGFVPENERKTGNKDDLAKNNVLYNLALLKENVEKAGKKSELNGYHTELCEEIDKVLDAVDGKLEQAEGDTALENLSTKIAQLYDGIDVSAMGFGNAEERKHTKELFQRVAAGLKMDSFYSRLHVTEQQKKDAEDIRKNGAEKVNAAGKLEHFQGGKPSAEEEKIIIDPDPEPVIRPKKVNRPAAAASTYYAHIDDLKAQMNRLPEGADNEDIKRQEIEICMKIFAARRAAGCERDKKSMLQIPIDNKKLADTEKLFGKDEVMKDFFAGLTSAQRRDLATTGHGGKMEDKFKVYINDRKEIHGRTHPYYMPTAKARIESLEEIVKKESFAALSPEKKVSYYREILATRAAVDSVRNNKKSLEKQIDPKVLAAKRKMLASEPYKTAMLRAAQKPGALDAARKGHAGAFEDLLRDELREMGCSADSDYTMKNVDKRFAPTYAQRMNDVLLMTISNGKKIGVKNIRMLSAAPDNEQKKKLFAEFAVNMDYQGAKDPGDRIDNIEEYNTHAKYRAKAYSQLVTDEDLRRFTKQAVNGTSALGHTLKNFQEFNKGKLLLLTKEAELDDLTSKIGTEKYPVDINKKAIVELAAEKMVLGNNKEENWDSNYSLEVCMSKDNFKKDVSDMKKQEAFKQMTNNMSAKDLFELVKKGKDALTEEYNKVENSINNNKERDLNDSMSL